MKSSVDTSSLPDVTVKNLNGEEGSTSTFNNDGKPFVVIIWASWSSPSKRQLNTIHDVYEDWREETGVKIIGISIDDARNKHKVKPYVASKSWEYEMYIDSDQAVMKQAGVENPPHTFLFDGNGELVWQKNGFVDGDEDELFEQVKTLSH